ncbi:glycosyltransferase family 2 protein [Flavobacterium sp. HJJ]|uniref:glycosyltransferase family 2 protein n=1 Tax=Flavobacterium sp. HJJ TaxID=2783792 RepID=UPI00188AE64B|nr:glycosyltransferase [Flavobacterium sp. HJJ]MBF4470300.1 glycosyltransferase [Flavobacterium sp. HJJ]
MELNSLVSIIIPCYNDWQYVEQAVDSALNQTYAYKEVIIVDDGSNSKTKEVLKRIEPKITKVVTQENKGQSTARNVGIREASGEYILVLDSDDFFEPTFCEKAVALFSSNDLIKIITCFTNRIFDKKKMDVFKPKGGSIDAFLITNCAMGSAMFRKSDWQKVFGYEEKMTNGFEDWEFYIRLLKEKGTAYVIPEVLFNYRIKTNSTTTKANKVKYTLLKGIYLKHKDLYIDHYENFIFHLLARIEREEKEKIKNALRLEFRIGKAILNPIRFIKSLFI